MKKPAKHTPGPWQAAPFRGNIAIQNQACQVGNVIGTDAQAQADAALIAAAPDLLTVLAEYIDFNGEYAASMPDDAWVERARSAVAKATGCAQ